MSRIYLLLAEHWRDNGRVLKAFNTENAARSEAQDLVAIMLRDSGLKPSDDWNCDLALLQEIHGAQNCYVEITPLQVHS